MNHLKNLKTHVLCMSIIVLLNTAYLEYSWGQNDSEEKVIPKWFKNNVLWWEENKITSSEVINALEFFWHKEIIQFEPNDTDLEFYSKNFSIEEYNKTILDLKKEFESWEKDLILDQKIIQTISNLNSKGIINKFDSNPPRLSAAIIDVLDQSIPNQSAQQKIQKLLEHAGYEVDVFTSKDTTVEFYKKLPSLNYNFIYIRTHSLEVPELNNTTFLFTGEEYSVEKYFSEQITGQLGKGIPSSNEIPTELGEGSQNNNEGMYFMVSSRFVEQTMLGAFPNSVIIIGGCESAKNEDIASSFFSRGASSFIGWNSPILAGENDRAMLSLFEDILVNNSQIQNSIDSVMEKYESNLKYKTTLEYFSNS